MTLQRHRFSGASRAADATMRQREIERLSAEYDLSAILNPKPRAQEADDQPLQHLNVTSPQDQAPVTVTVKRRRVVAPQA